jgi:SAM-dependent methyltransferase
MHPEPPRRAVLRRCAENRGMSSSLDTHQAPAQRRAAAKRLKRRLAQLRRVFDLDAIASQPADAPLITRYYHQNFHPYRRYHSADGAMHMALNPGGRFDRAGYTGQAQHLEARWAGQPPADVLELAFGKGFNLEYLAPRWPGVRFSGIDLTPRNVRHAQSRPALAGVALSCADMHELPFEAGSFDCVFCVEGFCHATDVPRALAEQARVLRPGGLFVLFDGYRERTLEEMSAEEALAVAVVEKSMAVDSFQHVGTLIEQAAAAGLELVSNESLVASVMPNFRRLDRMASLFLLVPPLTRHWLAGRSAERGRNLAAAALGRWTVSMGLQGYREMVWCKGGGGG